MLKGAGESRSSLRCRLTDQEQLTNFAKKRAERFEKAGAEIVLEACCKRFIVGFECYKSMVLAYLFIPSTELPKVYPLDKSLKVG